MTTILPHWRTGYGVTFYTSGSMRFARYARVTQALEAAQAHALNTHKRAEVTPNRGNALRWNGRLVESVAYWEDRDGLQYVTNERPAG